MLWPKHTGMNPGTALISEASGRKFRLGYVLNSPTKGYIGITVRHVFEGRQRDTILDLHREKMSIFQEQDQLQNVSGHARHLAVFPVRDRYVGPDNISMGGVWPRSAIDPKYTMGLRVWPTNDDFTTGGVVTELESIVKVSFPGGYTEIVKGLLVVQFEDEDVIRPGIAGTPFVSETGEAVGIALAGRKNSTGAVIFLLPIFDFLTETKSRLWVPPGAHWSDIDRKLERFLRHTASHSGPNLGAPPRVRHKGI